MSRTQKLFLQAKQSPNNFSFQDLCTLLRRVGYIEDRITGSHHIFWHPDIADHFVNIQPVKGKAKPTQVRDVVEKIEYYGLLEG